MIDEHIILIYLLEYSTFNEKPTGNHKYFVGYIWNIWKLYIFIFWQTNNFYILIYDNILYLNYAISVRKTNDLRDLTTVELLYNM